MEGGEEGRECEEVGECSPLQSMGSVRDSCIFQWGWWANVSDVFASK